MLEWLERLGFDKESRQTVVHSRLGFAIRRLKDPLSVNPAVNGYIFESGKYKTARDEPRFSSAVHKGLKSSLPLRLLGYGKPLPLPVISNTNNNILIFYHNYEMKTKGCVATVREWTVPPLLLLVVFFPEKSLRFFKVKFTSRNGYIVKVKFPAPSLSPSTFRPIRSPFPLSLHPSIPTLAKI